MTDPALPIPPRLEPRVIERGEKPADWTTYEYRGAKVRHSQCTAILQMPGHPYDGGNPWSNPQALFRIIGAWVERKEVPAPYMWPVPAR
jgi:hypothetical protein